MSEIIPAILPKSFEELSEKLSSVRGLVETVQIDICDGAFVPTRTWPYVGDHGQFAQLASEKTGLPYWEEFDFEFDLMVREPENVFPSYIAMGAKRIIVHLESIKSETLSKLFSDWTQKVEIALALKPSTPLSLLDPFIHEVSLVQCMGNDKIGFGGVALD